MKKTATIMVIAVGPGGHHRGGAPFSHSACGSGESNEDRAMISIPVEALSTDAEDNSNVAPEIGDEVTLPEVKARVKKIEEGEAYVEILSVGGMPAEYENKDTEKTEMPEDEQSMRKMVEKYDSEMES